MDGLMKESDNQYYGVVNNSYILNGEIRENIPYLYGELNQRLVEVSDVTSAAIDNLYNRVECDFFTYYPKDTNEYFGISWVENPPKIYELTLGVYDGVAKCRINPYYSYKAIKQELIPSISFSSPDVTPPTYNPQNGEFYFSYKGNESANFKGALYFKNVQDVIIFQINFNIIFKMNYVQY